MAELEGIMRSKGENVKSFRSVEFARYRVIPYHKLTYIGLAITFMVVIGSAFLLVFPHGDQRLEGFTEPRMFNF